MPLTRERTAEWFAGFLLILDAQGLRAALADLLTRTDYRFIAVFRFNGDRAKAVVFYDREDPSVLRVAEVAANATFCDITRRQRSTFVTDDAIADARLENHVARDQVRAYCGVPIMTPEGEFLGTLCHYDHVPRDASQIDLALMCEIASTIEQRGIIPAYAIAT